eukprot:6363144-Prorocentrum_lima.AAC.1
MRRAPMCHVRIHNPGHTDPDPQIIISRFDPRSWSMAPRISNAWPRYMGRLSSRLPLRTNVQLERPRPAAPVDDLQAALYH